MPTGDFYSNITASSFTNTITDTIISPIYNSTNTVMHVSNDKVIIHGELHVKDVDIGAALSDIMKTLMVIERDLEMERRYPKLKEAYDHYNKILSDYQLIDDMKGKL